MPGRRCALPMPEHLDHAVAPRLQRRAHRDRRDLDVTGDDVGERRRCAAIVHGLQLHAGHAFEQRDVDVSGRADAGRAVADRARLRLGERDQFAHGVGRELRMRQQRLVGAHQAGDRREILHRIGQAAVERRIDHEDRLRAEHQHVAVGRAPWRPAPRRSGDWRRRGSRRSPAGPRPRSGAGRPRARGCRSRRPAPPGR